MRCAPAAKVEEVIFHVPSAAEVTEPITVVPSNSVTRVLAFAVPSKVGVVMLVMLSPRVPVSEAGSSCGCDGAGVGITVSIVTGRTVEAGPILPATSVAVAVMFCTPLGNTVVLLMDQLPLAEAMAVPITVVPSYSVTVEPASAVPSISGIVTLVMPSVFDTPESVVASTCKAVGGTGFV